MDDNTRIYAVELFDSPDTYYYMASDVNAIFERSFFNTKIRNVVLVESIFRTYEKFKDTDKNCYLFVIDYEILSNKINNKTTYVIAPTMKDAYETITKDVNNLEKLVLINCQCIAPINYVRSIREVEYDLEAMRIG